MPLFKGVSSKSSPRKAIDYITREDKAAYVSVRNLFEDEDYAEQFEQTASQSHKGGKFNERKYYHFKLSCARSDNVNSQEAHIYATELAARLFKDLECVIATHTDTQTVHSHIIVNAVNPVTGKKLRIGKGNYTSMKDEANRLGEEMGFTPLNFRKKSKNKRTAEEQHVILKGGTSWKEELREVIAEAIKNSTTPEQFKEYLDKCYGVKITRDGKDYSYLHPEKQKPIRGEKLGTNYIKSEVIRKIGEQNNRIKSSTHNRGRGGFNGQPSGAGVMQGSKTVHGTSTGGVVTASLGGIEREMQQLDFNAKCVSCGTDAASEERRMAERAAREEAERRRRETIERREREQQAAVEQSERNVTEDNDNGNGDRKPSKYSYGKGD